MTQSSAQWLKEDWMSLSSINFSAMQERTSSIKIKWENDLAVTITARHNYENTFLSTVLTYISRYIKTDVNGNVSQDGIWSNIGVVVQSNNEQSYIGITIRIKNYYK